MADIDVTITQPADISVTVTGGILNFLSLTDIDPTTYSGQSGKTVTVNSGEDGLEFTNAGSGDVVGPGVAVNENITVFDSTTGKIIKDSGVNISEVTANTSKTGITSQQSTDITTNNAKNTNVSTDLSEGTSTETTVDVNSSDGTNATLASASTLRAGLLTKAKFDEIVVNNGKVSYTDAAAVGSNTTHRGLTNNPHTVTATQVSLGNVSDVATSDTAYNATSWNTNLDSATKNVIRDKVETMDTAIGLNTSKVTNATHTGDVTGSTALTIGVDKIKDTMIDFGTGANQVSTADIPEQTNLYYTEGRVTANSSVSANTSKVTNATHTGDVTGATSLTIGVDKVKDTMIDFGTGAGQVSTADLPEQTNLYYTEGRVSANTDVSANTSKVTNVSTNLSAGTRTATTIKVDSSDGTDATLVEADTTNAGILGSDKWDEIVANTLKDTNVSTNLSEGISTNTTVDVNSSDGTNATLAAASTSRAGLLTKAKFDEIVANTSASHAESHTIVSHSDTTATGAELDTLTGGGDTTLHDHDGISENTTHRSSDGKDHSDVVLNNTHRADNTQAHSDYLLNSGTDVAVGPLKTTADNSSADTEYIPNVLYNTDATPPTASTVPIGTIYIQYTA